MPTPEPQHAEESASADAGPPPTVRLPVLRYVAVVIWGLLLIAFWLLLRRTEAGPVELLVNSAQQVIRSGWAPAGLLALYLLRPFLLVPITVLNLASGLAFGPVPGIPLALAGTLISASMGYGIGRLLGSAELADRLSHRWRFVRLLRARSFEAVIGGGLMYLHADMVNLPAGMLRLHFPTFLLGISIGNSLTLTMAVLAGAAIEGGIRDAALAVDLRYVAMALALFLLSVLLARLLRRRIRPESDGVGLNRSVE